MLSSNITEHFTLFQIIGLKGDVQLFLTQKSIFTVNIFLL